MRIILGLIATSVALQAQISGLNIETTQSQAVFSYTAPDNNTCSILVADMNRGITITSATQSSGVVTVTAKAPHGLLAGAVIYVEASGVSAWDGYETVTSVPNSTTFSFSNVTAGVSSGGAAGVLIDDVNPALYSGANLDSRTGSINQGRRRQLVIGLHDSPVALDGNRYSRALQVASRHVYTLTCGSSTLRGAFTTTNAPVGYTLGAVPPVDRTSNQYGYPTIQWSNQYQTLIDPVTGFRSVRATAPVDSPSGSTEFFTAFDPESAWNNPTGPVTSGGGTATFNSPCTGTNCYLFLRADNLTISDGASYTTGLGSGAALDWVQVTMSNTSMVNACSGNDCVIQICLTVDGVSCATPYKELTLSTRAGTYTAGTQQLMDLWQTAGAPSIVRPDITRATGTVNYTASTKVVTLAGGNPFSIKWNAGSRIKIGSVEYSIASVQNEAQLTLSAGPSSNQSGAAYSANNFGALIRKKTATANTVSIGYTTYAYGNSGMPIWDSASVQNCASVATPGPNGAPGYNCFVSTEMFWISSDGSQVNDLGLIQTAFYQNPDSPWGNSQCGSSAIPSIFDPKSGDAWYCVLQAFGDSQRYSIVKGQYVGDHRQGTPGTPIRACDVTGGNFSLNFNPPPCLRFTLMQPNKSDSISQTAPSFNPEYALWPAAQATNNPAWLLAGVSSDGHLRIFTRSLQAQNSPGWFVIYDLGDGTPAGTDINSLHVIAMGSSFAHYPFRWCGIHAIGPPHPGWQVFGGDPTSASGPAVAFTGTLSSTMNVTPAACPVNGFGVTGSNCSDITVSTNQPIRSVDGLGLGVLTPGDVLLIDNEFMRIMTVTDAAHINVQRFYPPSFGVPSGHASGTMFTMQCGVINQHSAMTGFWNYIADPLGKNQSGTAMLLDPNQVNGHNGENDFVQLSSGTGGYEIGENLCPDAYFQNAGANCYELRFGFGQALVTAAVQALAVSPLFAGKFGAGTPNNVDSHPGACFGAEFCVDARPLNGWGLGIQSSPNTAANIPGTTIWKYTAAQNSLNRKQLPTFAYVGRMPLVDVSGPGSNVTRAVNTYCVALLNGECYSGSLAGEIYVNAPFVSSGQCTYPGVAIQPDDRNAICIGDLLTAGNVWQVGVASQDMTGSRSRPIGNLFSRFNQDSVFWNVIGTPTPNLVFSQARWLDGVRHEDILTILPPYPTPDTVARNTFIPTPVSITPPGNSPVNNVIIEFGYGDFGDPGNFYCSSRQETCVAVGNSVNTANPYFYEHSESYSGIPCARGCTITIPALPQRILYYRCKYRNANGNVIATSQTGAIATP